jgi:hypothetical protein
MFNNKLQNVVDNHSESIFLLTEDAHKLNEMILVLTKTVNALSKQTKLLTTQLENMKNV